MNDYAKNRIFGDSFMPAAKSVLKGIYSAEMDISIASDKLDTKEASDLILHGAKSKILNDGDRVAVRVRKHGYADRYPNEFTIRSRAMFGGETEYNKIMSGMGDFFLYAHAEQIKHEFARWLLIDLANFRYAIENMKIPKESKSNFDGTRFYAFNIYDFPPTLDLVVAGSHAMESRQVGLF